MDVLTGIIQADGSVICNEDGTRHFIGKRGEDKEGYPQVLIDAKEVGGDSSWARQSVKPFIGMAVDFVRVGPTYPGYNFIILKNSQK